MYSFLSPGTKKVVVSGGSTIWNICFLKLTSCPTVQDVKSWSILPDVFQATVHFFPLVQVFFSANMHLRDMFFNITLPRIPSPSEVINNWPLISSSAKKSCTSDPMLTSLVMDWRIDVFLPIIMNMSILSLDRWLRGLPVTYHADFFFFFHVF